MFLLIYHTHTLNLEYIFFGADSIRSRQKLSRSMSDQKLARKSGLNLVLELFKTLARDRSEDPDNASITIKLKDLRTVIELLEGFVDIADDGFQLADIPAIINLVKKLL